MHTATEQKKNRIVMLDIGKDGKVSEILPGVGQEYWLDNTLLGNLYPDIRVALVSVPTEILEYAEAAAVSDRLVSIEHEGVQYRMVGASGSAKNGNFYFADAQHAPVLAKRFQNWPEAAITYFGILMSVCKVVLNEEARVLVVPDNELGTNDCRGWIRQALFEKLGVKGGAFYQFRLAFGETQAKGSFKVMGDEVADALDVDIIVPESSVKPSPTFPPFILEKLGFGSRRTRGPVAIGIREVSKGWTFESSYTVLQNAPENAIFSEIVPPAREMINELIQAWREHNHRKIVELVGKEVKPSDLENSHSPAGDAEYQRVIEAVLLADGTGEITQHPYVHSILSKLIARWAYKLLTGGNLHLPAFALADDGYLFLQNGKVVCGSDWLPRDTAVVTEPITSSRGLCVRYPVRMKEDLLPLKHAGAAGAAELLMKQGLAPEVAARVAKEQLCLRGTYTLHSKTAKKNGGDFDFDMVCCICGDRYPQFVESRFSLADNTEVEKTKTDRARSPWYNIEFCALKVLGNQIGVITDLMSSALANGREDLVYELVPELQKEIDSLKHNIRADRSKLKSIREELKAPEWLRLKEAKSLKDLPEYLEILPTDRIGKLYNALRKDVSEMTGKPMAVAQFAGLIVGNNPTEAMFQECRLINNVFAAGHGMIRAVLEREQSACKAIEQQLTAAIELKDQLEIGRLRKELSKARASLRVTEERTKKQSSRLCSVISAWGQSKKSDRKAWCQALHLLICRSKSEKTTGSILFHAFPQEVVDAIAGRTGGARTLVEPPLGRAAVLVEGNALYTMRKGAKAYLFSYDEKARTIRV